MKFLCLCYYDAEKFASWTPEDREAIARGCPPHDAALRATGKVALVASLALPREAKVVRPHPSDGPPAVTDGAFRETSEPLGAFFLVEAPDLDTAAAVAALHPGAHLGRYFGGGIEVRPCDAVEDDQASLFP
jgi:hypothetical protein